VKRFKYMNLKSKMKLYILCWEMQRKIPRGFDDLHTRPVFTSSAKARRPKPREGARVNARSDRVHMAIWVQFKVAKGLIRQWIEIKEGYSLEIVPFFLL